MMVNKATKMVPTEVFVSDDGMDFPSYREASEHNKILQLTKIVSSSFPVAGSPEEMSEWILNNLGIICDISREYTQIKW